MAYNKNLCGTITAYTGQTECSEDFGYVRKVILSNTLLEFATQSDAETYANWISAITGATTPQAYPFPVATNLEDQSEEPIVEEVSRDEKIFIANGERRIQLRLNEDVSLGLHQQLQKFNGRKPYVYLVTDNGFIRGTSADGTKFQAIKSTSFYVSRSEATVDGKQATYVTVGFEDEDWTQKGVWINPVDLTSNAWNPVEDLDGVKLVDLVQVTATTATIVYKIEGTYDSAPEVGDPADTVSSGLLEQTDFTFSTTLDGEISTFTNNQDGTYTLVPTTTFTVTGDTIDLKAPSTTGHRLIQSAQLALSL